MNTLALQEKIRYYLQRIDDLSQENRQIEDKLASLDDVEQKYQRKHAALETSQWNENARSNEVRGVAAVKAADSYADVLSGMVSGADCCAAHDAFMGIMNTINNYRQDLNEDIDYNNQSIINLTQEIAYLRSRIASLS